ncbi:MAG: DNA polymerase III subunit delta [Myxococcales bacterium]|nr:DNA polymerase III subunit delta [Myxococcales bacterium]MCB9735565.1 DNA polymerase III subunit delta [Deltaproteobacteria bacterium]
MDLGALEQSLKKNGPKPVYALLGSEQLLIDEAERMILRAAVGSPPDRMALTRVDLSEPKTGAKEIVAACRALGLFAPPRIAIVVRAAELLDKKPTEREEVVRYLEAPVPTATLVLKASELDGRTALLKRVKKHGEAYVFKPLYESQAAPWVAARAREKGHRLDNATARRLVELVGTDLLALSNALEQLSLYAGRGEPIGERELEACLAATRSHSIFELVDAVGQRDTAGALRHVHAMLGQREPALRILASIARHFQHLWRMVVAKGRGATLDEATSILGLHPFQAKKMWPQTQKFAEPALRRALERLYAADVQLKSSPLPDELVLERLMMDLCLAR